VLLLFNPKCISVKHATFLNSAINYYSPLLV